MPKTALDNCSNTLSRTVFAHSVSASRDNERADAKSLVASILIQLLKSDVTERPEHQYILDDMTNLCFPKQHIDEIPFEKLHFIFARILGRIRHYTLIIDGLDECVDLGNVKTLADDLIQQSSLDNSQIIIFSRKHDNLRQFMSNSSVLEISTEITMPDIKLFIAAKIAEIPSLKRIEMEIYTKIDERCQGMFLWAVQMIEYLTFPSPRSQWQQRKRLEEVPRGLFEIFEQLVAIQGEKLTKSDLKLRRTIFQLIVAAKRPLKIEEIDAALQFRGRQRVEEIHRLFNARQTVVDLCSPFVCIAKDSVALAHGSYQNFLLEPERNNIPEVLSVHQTKESSNASLAYKCLSLLCEDPNKSPRRISHWLYKGFTLETSCDASQNKDRVEALREIVFYEYAARYWDFHLTSVSNPSKELLQLFNDFLHGFEFVMWSEYLIDFSGTIGRVSRVYGGLESWLKGLPCSSRDLVSLDAFFSGPYAKLSDFYEKDGKDKLLKYLCLYRLGDFYQSQGDIEPQYKVRKEVADGLEGILGEENPLTLRAKVTLAFIYTNKGELIKALNICLEVSIIQKDVIGMDRQEYWETRQEIGLIQFLMTDFESAAITQAAVIVGLEDIEGAQLLLFESYIFDGYVKEAQGLLSAAMDAYRHVRNSKTLAPNDGHALYARVCMASIYRKEEKYKQAAEDLEFVFAERSAKYKDKNKIDNSLVIDTAIHLIVLYREMRNLDQANAQIELISGSKILRNDFERYCQVEHLRALVSFDEGDFEATREILQSLLDLQEGKGREANNRSLLWVRLTLATVIRELGRDEEVETLFLDIVTALHDGNTSPQYENIRPFRELTVAEEALRLVRSRKQEDADVLLRKEKLRWTRKADFWLFEGGPSADTAWMKGP
ncbi:Vegetative incompatibility protein HET-E-1 [Lachnellula hyalina]|uniref:Vegetative incompatibility protein HET-E-1 n=1 Tax=Lachnellula hyalina TaxID=1316788 RepID=A0A8H8R6Q8_9HELO|nr:Vegetative incompatibility protein HET-E-1 [Lachnellula hyalina]TVY29026.1 Vegetative incompatibility protein HET-E-1 [Lachnellula hyalina]